MGSVIELSVPFFSASGRTTRKKTLAESPSCAESYIGPNCLFKGQKPNVRIVEGALVSPLSPLSRGNLFFLCLSSSSSFFFYVHCSVVVPRYLVFFRDFFLFFFFFSFCLVSPFCRWFMLNCTVSFFKKPFFFYGRSQVILKHWLTSPRIFYKYITTKAGTY